ncbi:MAG: tetratricopeptide repeat protein [Desulfobacterales bacterium]
MKEIRSPLFHTKKTDHQFMYYKADGICRVEPDEAPELDHHAFGIALSDAFCEKPFCREFIGQAVSFSEGGPVFCVLSLRMDGNTRNSHPEEAIGPARILQEVCKEEKGLWGATGWFRFACLFPEKTGTEGLYIANRIQNRLSHELCRTVTIGVAAYPLAGFTNDRTLENAEKALMHAAFFGPDSAVVFDAVSLNISGDAFYQNGNLAEAVAEFKAALEIDPNNVNVHNSLGVCLGQMGDLDGALNHFNRARSMDPQDSMVWYNTGLIYKFQKNTEKALEFFLKAGEIDENLFEAAFQAGKIYFEKNLPEIGKQYYRKAIDLKPGNNLNYRFLGECYMEMGMVDDAVAAYKKAILEHPNDAVALSTLGTLYAEKGENPEIAVLFCRQSIEIAPENALLHHRLGEVYEKQSMHENALLSFKKAFELGYDASVDIERIETVINGSDIN